MNLNAGVYVCLVSFVVRIRSGTSGTSPSVKCYTPKKVCRPQDSSENEGSCSSQNEERKSGCECHYGYVAVNTSDKSVKSVERQCPIIVKGRESLKGLLHNNHCKSAHLKDITDCLGNISATVLSLENVGLRDVEPGIFQSMPGLEQLSLGNNRIARLEKFTFASLTKLQYLLLSNNRISELVVGMFGNLTSLEVLTLDRNGISYLPPGVFHGLESLRYLILSNNNLTEVTKGVFNLLPVLEKLILHNNPIRIISSGVDISANYTRLYLMNTKIEEYDNRTFHKKIPIEVEIHRVYGLLEKVLFHSKDENTFTDVVVRVSRPDHLEVKVPPNFFGDVMKASLTYMGFAKIGKEGGMLPCDIGSYAFNESGKRFAKCVICPRGGWYSNTSGYVGRECHRCRTGTYIHRRNAPGTRPLDCQACPSGTNTQKFAGYKACDCLPRFFRNDTFSRCYQCKKLALGLVCLHDFKDLRPEFWWRWQNQVEFRRYLNFATLLENKSSFNESTSTFFGKLARTHQCPLLGSCLGKVAAKCKKGYEGNLCAVCSDTYYYSFGQCKKCPSKLSVVLMPLLLAALIVIIIALVMWMGFKKKTNATRRSPLDAILSKLKIVVGFYQVTYGLMEAFTYVEWPAALKKISDLTEVIQLNVLHFAPLHCAFPDLKLSPYQDMIAMMCVNAGIIVLFFVTHCLWSCCILVEENLDKRSRNSKLRRVQEVTCRNILFFLFVTYLGTCSKTARVLPASCREICLDMEKTNCTSYLKADFALQCYTQERTKQVYMAHWFSIYAVLLPTLSFAMVMRMHCLNPDRRPRDDEPALYVGLRFLHEQYDDDNWCWELLELSRKFLLTSGLILIDGQSRTYIGGTCIVSGIFTAAFAHRHPIKDVFENTLQLAALMVTFINLGIGTVSKIPSENIPVEVDNFADSAVFNAMVYGANGLVLGMLAVQYVITVYHNLKEWWKRPNCSMTCCLAVVLPLIDLRGDMKDAASTDIARQPVVSMEMEAPTIRSALAERDALRVEVQGRGLRQNDENVEDEEEEGEEPEGSEFSSEEDSAISSDDDSESYLVMMETVL